MKVFGAFVFATVAFAAAAPATNQGIPLTAGTQLYYREKRSQYPQYAAPCATAASAPIPTIAPTSYQVNVSPYHGYGSYGYPVPHYRSVEMEPEMLSFSDVEHLPMARYGYVQPAPVHPAAYSAPAPAVPVAAAATTGPVFSVFPNANTAGCSVPLLLSCQPSIVPGHVVQTQPHYYAGDNYRGVEGAPHHEDQDTHHEEPQIHEHVSTAHEPTHATVHQ